MWFLFLKKNRQFKNAMPLTFFSHFVDFFVLMASQ